MGHHALRRFIKPCLTSRQSSRKVWELFGCQLSGYLMDENTLPASEVDASPDTSCSYTSCLLRLLHKKRPNDHLQLVGNSYALVQLDNPEAYTSWPTFLALDDLLAGLASETEILTAGFLSWQHRGLYPYQKLAQSFEDKGNKPHFLKNHQVW
jgi:hypothetical protein